MGLEEFQRMPLGTERLWEFAIATHRFDPEVLDEFPESLHGLAGVRAVEAEVFHEPIDSVAHKLPRKMQGLLKAVRLEKKKSPGHVGQVGVFVEIDAVGAVGAFGFWIRWKYGFHAHRGGDFCSFQKWGIMQGV
jgi:hypothetical protein